MRTLGVRVALVYLALRAVSAVLLVLASRDQVVMPDWTGPTVEPIDMTVLWDGSWYRYIAEHGYPHPSTPAPVRSPRTRGPSTRSSRSWPGC